MLRFLLLLLLLLLTAPADAGRRQRDLPDVSELRLPETGEDFTFGPGDKLSIKVYKHSDLDADLLVAPDGTATLPLLGRVTVAGKTYSELVAELEAGFKEYYTDASVAVNVVEVNNRKVFVVGEVTNPAVLQITGELTLLEALVRTGGINESSRTDNMLLIRGNVEGEADLYTVDVERLMAGDLSQNPSLQSGDILVVPTKTIVNAERFFRHVQGILGPFVAGSQIYRNATMVGNTQVIDDSSGSE